MDISGGLRKIFLDILDMTLTKFEYFKDSSVSELELKRANSLGLDCTKVEKVLKIKMPDADQVIKNLIQSLERNH